jgi:hypothetical protein
LPAAVSRPASAGPAWPAPTMIASKVRGMRSLLLVGARLGLSGLT